MPRITLNEVTVARLGCSPGQIQVCDGAGCVVGLFESAGSRPCSSDRQISFDDELLEQLAIFTGGVELCDASGKVIGVFRPVVWWEAAGCWEPQFSTEELEQFENEPGRRTLAEIICDLKSRG